MASTTQTDARSPREPRAGLRSFAGRQLWPLFELFVLAGLAIAQPLLDVVGRSPDFLLLRRADAKDIALLALTITFGPPLVLWGLELLVGLAGRRAQAAVHLALVGGLMAVLGLEVAKKLASLPGPALVAVGCWSGPEPACCTPGRRRSGCGCATPHPAPLCSCSCSCWCRRRPSCSGRRRPAPSRRARPCPTTAPRSSSSCSTSCRCGRRPLSQQPVPAAWWVRL